MKSAEKNRWWHIDAPELRLEAARIVLPLVILGFLSTRLIHAPHWIGQTGFNVPDLGGHWTQPLYLPPLPDALAWLLVAVLVSSGLAVSLGWQTRIAAGVFTAALSYVLFADRLSAFTVSKLAPVVALTLAIAPAGRRFGLDARFGTAPPPDPALALGPIRFLQWLPVVLYSASGLCKARGDWLDRNDVLWTYLHDSYQSAFAHWLAAALPAPLWGALQWSVLVFEIAAPLWLFWSVSRRWGVLFSVGMHIMIGLLFAPVIWFSLLMIALVTIGFGTWPARTRRSQSPI